MDKLPYYEAVISEIYDKDCANCANCGNLPRCTGCTIKILVAGLEIIGCCTNFQKKELERMKKRGLTLAFSRESVDAFKIMELVVEEINKKKENSSSD